MNKQDTKNLIKRYLLWLYKTTKEAFDKYERKFTQLEVDKSLLKKIEGARGVRGVDKYIEEFRKYVTEKENFCLKLKDKGKRIEPEFLWLDIKLSAIEAIIKKYFGAKGLSEIKVLYEKEMQQRILKSMEHK
ncbi:MAG: hypothetical protein NC936_02580 [Candidatus Omnitrophica bacterium]|nr:hypothetical protein [Candidatus Omnitrophota bacterium]